jgi:hypothetical protein
MPFNNDTRLIFEKYVLHRESVETRMKYLLPLVPDVVGQDEQKRVEFVKKIAQEYDPSNEKLFTQWILKMIRNGSIRVLSPLPMAAGEPNSFADEDREKTFTTLKRFMQAKLHQKLKGTEADINNYKTLGSLTRHLDETLDDKTTKREQTKLQEQKGFEKIHESGKLQLYAITTPEAANKNLQQTQWCVKDPKYFQQYAEHDNTSLYYMIFDHSMASGTLDQRPFVGRNDPRKKILFNFKTNQYRNTYDEAVEPTIDQAYFILKARDYLESHEPENLGELYVRLFKVLGQPPPQIVIDNAFNNNDGALASALYDMIN